MLWLDDVREPWKHGFVGARWVKTYHEAIQALQETSWDVMSLDHDLSEQASMGQPSVGEKTGYDVLCWMEEHDVWPNEILVHTMNPSGRTRMEAVIKARKYRSFFR